jgi:hypothetical protein
VDTHNTRNFRSCDTLPFLEPKSSGKKKTQCCAGHTTIARGGRAACRSMPAANDQGKTKSLIEKERELQSLWLTRSRAM